MIHNQILQGDALTMLCSLPSESVQMCVTSPPYFGLRDYGIEDQIGLESSPDEYIAKLVEVFREVRRVLKDDGTLWLNIGDSYTGGGPHHGETNLGKSGTNRGSITGIDRIKPLAGLKPKDLMMIPARVAIALQADGYYLRSDIIWSKNNCMPESVTDRPTKSHEYLFLLSKNERYYYDAQAIMENVGLPTRRAASFRDGGVYTNNRSFFNSASTEKETHGDSELSFSGRNKRSVWTIASQPYSEAHFATFPPKLVEPCILAGSRPGDVVMDCFMGAGTTALVALQHNRDYLGIELNPTYVALIEKRIKHVQQNLWSEIS